MPWWSDGDWLDRVQIRFGRKRSQLAAEAMTRHYRSVFDSNSGRIVLADLFEEAGFFATAEGLSSDGVVFAAGKRHMATHIASRLNFMPKQTQQLAHLTSVETDDA